MERTHSDPKPLDGSGAEAPAPGECATEPSVSKTSNTAVARLGEASSAGGKNRTASPSSKNTRVVPVKADEAAIETGTGIAKETEKDVKRHFESFRKQCQRTVEEAWSLGEALAAAKTQVRHGWWLPWLKSMGLPRRSAQRFMQLYERYPEKRQVAHLESVDGALRALPPARTSVTTNGSTSSGQTISEESPTDVATTQDAVEGAKETSVGKEATPAGTDTGGDGPRDSRGGDLATAADHVIEVLKAAPAATSQQRLSDLREVFKVLSGLGPQIARRRRGLSVEEAGKVSRWLAVELRGLLEIVEGGSPTSRKGRGSRAKQG